MTPGHLVSDPEAVLLPLGLGTHGTLTKITFPAPCTILLCHIQPFTVILPDITSFGSLLLMIACGIISCVREGAKNKVCLGNSTKFTNKAYLPTQFSIAFVLS